MSTKQLTIILSAIVLIGALGWIGYLASVEANDQAGPGGHQMEEADEEHDALMKQPKEASNGSARLTVTLDPQTGAEVGDAVRFGARVTDLSGRPITNVLFSFELYHIEDDKVVFASRGLGPDGTISFQFAPFDGVPYEVRVNAASSPQSSAQFGILQAKPVVFMEALAPPLRVKILNTFYLVAIVGLGVALGLWATLRRGARAPVAARPRTAAVPA
jgi:hypothetical protein